MQLATARQFQGDYTGAQAALDEKNPPRTRGSQQSLGLDLSGPDRSDDELFNHILWEAIKGERVPYPGATRMSLLEMRPPSGS